MSEAILAIAMKITLLMLADKQATLLFAGDAMMHQAQIEAAREGKATYCYTDCFTEIKPAIQEADFAVVNLETPLGFSDFTGYPCFNAPVSYATALCDAGFDMMLTANNHTLDRRDRGLKRTVAALDSLQIPHIGTYTNAAERSKRLPKVVSIKGFKVGFLNYTYGTNGIKIQSDAVVDYIDRELMAADIAAARHAGAELVVVNVHWGEEYQLLPNRSQTALADFLFANGADAVIGNHPHVVQPYELRTNPATGRKQALVYSLGNFISNMKTRDTRGGALATLKLSRDSSGVPVIDTLQYSYIFTLPPGGAHRNFRVVPLDSVPAAWRAPAMAFRNALKVKK